MSGLGEPVRLGPRVARNRIVFPAHLTNAAADRRPSAQHAAYYGARAAGGAGLIITEEQSVDPADRPYEKLCDGTDPAVVPGYRVIADAVHLHGALVLAQIGHNGGQSWSRYSRAPVEAPSAVPDPMFREVPRPLSPARIARIVAGFATVARHAREGGLDGVEVQGSQASLVRQFLSPRTNRRADRYRDGVLFLVEVLVAVRDALGPDHVLGVRLQGDEGLDGGLGTADAVAVARRIAGFVDYVSTAVGVATETLPMIEPPMGVPAGYAAALPRALRTAVGVPVLGVGRFTTPEEAAATVAAGDCDLVGVVRGQIADPEFAAKALAGRRVRRCVGCNQECIARVGLDQRLGCVVNPRAGRESVALPVPSLLRPRRRVLVVGGGPAGLSAAAGAVARGHDVELVEASTVLGGQVAVAAAAPGRGELAHLVADLAEACAGATLRTGVCADAGLVTTSGADAVVLAIGAVPAVPTWGVGVERVVDVADVLAGRVRPTGRVLVVDDVGGHPAPSTAELLAGRGARVTLVTAGMVAVEGLGRTLERARWRRRAAALGIEVLTDRVVLAAAPGPTVTVLAHVRGESATWSLDWVVTAAPRIPSDGLWQELRSTGVPVRRVGDAVAPRGLDAAVREGDAVDT